MKNELGYTHWVITILISIMAVGLVGAAWYYETKKGETVTNTTAKTNSNNTNNTTNKLINANTVTVLGPNNNTNNDFGIGGASQNLEVQNDNTTNDTNVSTNINTNATLNTNDIKETQNNDEEIEWLTYTNEEYSFSINYPEKEWSFTEEVIDDKPLFSLVQNSDITQFIKIYPLGKSNFIYPHGHEVDSSYLGGIQIKRKLFFDEYLTGNYNYILCQYVLSGIPMPMEIPELWIPMFAPPNGGLSFEASCDESDELKDILSTFTFLE